MLLYFQVCSNSAYPQYLGERYRSNGPLVLNYIINPAYGSSWKCLHRSMTNTTDVLRYVGNDGHCQRLLQLMYLSFFLSFFLSLEPVSFNFLYTGLSFFN